MPYDTLPVWLRFAKSTLFSACRHLNFYQVMSATNLQCDYYVFWLHIQDEREKNQTENIDKYWHKHIRNFNWVSTKECTNENNTTAKRRKKNTQTTNIALNGALVTMDGNILHCIYIHLLATTEHTKPWSEKNFIAAHVG